MEVVDRGEVWEFRLVGNAFVRQMVRNPGWTLVEVGRGWFGPGEIDRIFEARTRDAAGPTLPPQGLFLSRIVYRPGKTPFNPPTVWETPPGCERRLPARARREWGGGKRFYPVAEPTRRFTTIRPGAGGQSMNRIQHGGSKASRPPRRVRPKEELFKGLLRGPPLAEEKGGASGVQVQ